jgi:2C-methyl-D-erythritol 2,4-cyclodiphosphate synthase
MGSLRKTVSSNLGEETDKDLINYVSSMEKKGINNSKLIKQALRFYKDYGNKVKQLDIASILDNPEVKEYIGNIVGELVKSATPRLDPQINDKRNVKRIKSQQQEEEIDSIESDYMKKLNCLKDMSS